MAEHHSEITAGLNGDLLSELYEWLGSVRQKMAAGSVYWVDFGVARVPSRQQAIYCKVRWRDPVPEDRGLRPILEPDWFKEAFDKRYGG